MSTVELRVGAFHLAIDHELCSGSGRCRDIAPDIFQISDRRAWLTEETRLTDAHVEQLRRAERSCPWFAITFTLHGAPDGGTP